MGTGFTLHSDITMVANVTAYGTSGEASTLANSMGVHRIGLLPTLEVFELQHSVHSTCKLKTFNISYDITPSAFNNNYNTSCGGAAGLPDSKDIPILHSHNNTTPFDLLSLLYLPPILWPGFHDRRCPGIRVRCTSIVTLPCGAVPHRCPRKSFDTQVNLTRLELDIYMHALHAFSSHLPTVFSDPMHAALKQAMSERGPNDERGPLPLDLPYDGLR